MSSAITKRKILDNALLCFNREGLSNVRLQHIAEEANMSIGNMTYHFRTKDDIVRAVWRELLQAQLTLLSEFRVLPLFEDIERLLRSTFVLQQQYAFFYVDTLEVMRAYPDIQAEHRQHIAWQEQQMALALAFNHARGALLDILAEEEQRQLLAARFWTLTDTWIYRCQVKGLSADHYELFARQVWDLLFPYFTQTGKNEFRQMLFLFSEKSPIFEGKDNNE